MKKTIASCAAASMCAAAVPAAAAPAEEDNTAGNIVYWQSTTNQNRWVDMGTLETTEWDNDTGLYIDVDQTVRYQTLTSTPWGGCFNDRGWAAMKALTDEQRAGIVADLFSDDGLGLTVGRMPLGNSDYSINRTQSYDELPDGVETDYNMEYFSIDSDREYLLPYIREAMKVRPELKLWASPWSPPSWMKQNKTTYAHVTPEDKAISNGKPNAIIWTPEILTAYADYFVNFIKAYRDEEGIEISMVMPQNEPTIDVGYASCVWTGEQLNEFIRDYLYPALQENGLETDIFLGTFTDSQANRTDPTLEDPVTSKIIKGLGMQWWSAPLTNRIYRNNQDIGYILMQSETKCGNGGNTWTYGEEHFDCMKEFLEAGVNEYMLWNMVLDENGINTNPYAWSQNAPIIVNSVTSEIIYTPMYYVTKHFTAYVEGGARRIKTEGNYGDKIAFQNADGENVLVVKNNSSTDWPVAINFNGRKIKPTIPAHSVNTFRIAGDSTGFDTDIDATYLGSSEDDELLTMVKLFNYNSPTKSLSVAQSSFSDGAELLAWDDRGAVEQQWTLSPTEDDWYKVINFNSEKVMGIWQGSKSPGQRAVQWSDNGSHDQQWRFIPVYKDGETYYKIQNRNSELFLTYGEGDVINGTLAVQAEDNDSDALLWSARATQGGDALVVLHKVTLPEGATAVYDGQLAADEVIVPSGTVMTIYSDYENGVIMPVMANGVYCPDGSVTITADTVIVQYKDDEGDEGNEAATIYTITGLAAEASENGLTVKINMVKNKALESDSIMIIAAYSSEMELLDCAVITVSGDHAKGESFALDADISAEDGDLLKAFVWDGLSGGLLAPLSNSFTTAE